MRPEALYKVQFELNDGTGFAWYLHSADALQRLFTEAQAGELGLLLFKVVTKEGDSEWFMSEPPQDADDSRKKS